MQLLSKRTFLRFLVSRPQLLSIITRRFTLSVRSWRRPEASTAIACHQLVRGTFGLPCILVPSRHVINKSHTGRTTYAIVHGDDERLCVEMFAASVSRRNASQFYSSSGPQWIPRGVINLPWVNRVYMLETNHWKTDFDMDRDVERRVWSWIHEESGRSFWWQRVLCSWFMFVDHGGSGLGANRSQYNGRFREFVEMQKKWMVWSRWSIFSMRDVQQALWSTVNLWRKSKEKYLSCASPKGFFTSEFREVECTHCAMFRISRDCGLLRKGRSSSHVVEWNHPFMFACIYGSSKM